MRAALNFLVTLLYTLVAILYVMTNSALPAALWSAGAGIWLALTIQALMED